MVAYLEFEGIAIIVAPSIKTRVIYRTIEKEPIETNELSARREKGEPTSTFVKSCLFG